MAHAGPIAMGGATAANVLELVNKRNNVTFPSNIGPIQLERIVQNPVV
jgi:hypothetical protein